VLVSFLLVPILVLIHFAFTAATAAASTTATAINNNNKKAEFNPVLISFYINKYYDKN